MTHWISPNLSHCSTFSCFSDCIIYSETLICYERFFRFFNAQLANGELLVLATAEFALAVLEVLLTWVYIYKAEGCKSTVSSPTNLLNVDRETPVFDSSKKVENTSNPVVLYVYFHLWKKIQMMMGKYQKQHQNQMQMKMSHRSFLSITYL